MRKMYDYKPVRKSRVLSEKQVEEVRRLRKSGLTYKQIAEKTNVSAKTIHDACKGMLEGRNNHANTDNHKTKSEIAKQIRIEFNAGETRAGLAEKYGFSVGWITQIITNKVYFDESYKAKEQRIIPDNSNFTVEEIKSMRKRYDDGEDIWSIAGDYRNRLKCNKVGTIRKICKREMFKNVL